jgi:phosphatidylserine decarboxylase
VYSQEIKTNQKKLKAGSHFIERDYSKRAGGGIPAKLGEEIAFFNLGSTVVLLFESPEFLFLIKRGQRVRISVV